MMKNRELLQFPGAGPLVQAAADQWLGKLSEPAREGRKHLAAFSGGRIASDFFAAIVRAAGPKPELLSPVHFFWADERCVPPEDSESNYLIARQRLFEPLRVPGSSIHRIRGEAEPEAAAQEASRELMETAGVGGGGEPVFDMIFLGMGEDGHVASLFPGAPAEVVQAKGPYLAVIGAKPPPRRITLSFAAIAAAREVWVLISGVAKEGALREALSGEGDVLPMARVIKSRTHTRIFTDLEVA